MSRSNLLRPAERSPGFDVEHVSSLAVAWQYSAGQYQKIRDAIEPCLPEFVACAAVSGSLARMEAHQASDIDLILVLDDRQCAVADGEANAVFDEVWRRLDELGAVRPKPGGIFSECARWTQLTDPAMRGRVDESLVTFGHRIQLLMDAQPVTDAERFLDLQRDLLSWYSETQLMSMFEEPGPFHWLWQDVQRYWRSLRSRTCWVNADDTAKAVSLNVKLRSSRLMLVSSFLLTLQQAQWGSVSCEQTLNEQDIVETVSDDVLRRLTFTPTERLFGDGKGIQQWDLIWTWLRDTASCPTEQLPDDVRQSLQELAENIRQTVSDRQTGQPDLPWLF